MVMATFLRKTPRVLKQSLGTYLAHALWYVGFQIYDGHRPWAVH